MLPFAPVPIDGPSKPEKLPWTSACVGKVSKPLPVGRLPGALIVAEDEEAILDNRAARGPAKLVLSVYRPWRADIVVLPRVGIQVAVLEDFPDTTVELVGPGFKVDVDHATGGAAILRVISRWS